MIGKRDEEVGEEGEKEKENGWGKKKIECDRKGGIGEIREEERGKELEEGMGNVEFSVREVSWKKGREGGGGVLEVGDGRDG